MEFEAKKLFTALDAYPRALGVELSAAMRFSFRRLILRIMAWTPPTSGRGASNAGAAQKAGAAAIRKDIMRIVFIEQAAILDFWQQQNHGYAEIDSLTLNRKGTRQQYTLRNLVIDPNGSRLADLHTRMRNSRGRIPSNYKGQRLGVTPEAFSRFLAREQSHSGIAKAGWIAGLAHFGGQSPAWIARHGGADGSFVDTTSQELFTMEVTNRARSIGSLAPRLIQSSLAAEARATLKELERAVDKAGYASKLISKIAAS